MIKSILYSFIVVILYLSASACSSSHRGYNGEELFLTDIPLPSVKPIPNDSCVNWNLTTSDATDFLDKEIDRIEIMELDMTDQSVIGSISKLKITDDAIYVADAGKAQKLFVFNNEGNFLHTIGSYGEGPGEYISINGIKFENDNVSIVDWLRNRITSYDYDGKCLKEYQMSNNCPSDFALLPNEEILGSYTGYTPFYPFSLVWLRNDSILDTALPFTISRDRVAGVISRSMENETLLYYPEWNDTIYCIRDHSISPKFTMGLIDSEVVNEYLIATTSMTPDEFRRNWDTYKGVRPPDMIKLTETSNKWIIQFQINRDGYICVVDKSDNTARCYRRTDFDKRRVYFPFVLHGNIDASIVAAIDEQFMKLDKEDRENVYRKCADRNIGKLIENYNFEENNPLVCRIWLKQ